MRRKRIVRRLTLRRARGLALLAVGKSTKEVARVLKVTPRSVRRWRHPARHPQRKRAPRPLGRPRKLSTRQEQQLAKAVQRGAYAYGYAEDYWTLDRIGQVIWQLFAVRYHPSAIWHILDRMGWSCQRPQRRALQRDAAAIARWKEQEVPRIKKVS